MIGYRAIAEGADASYLAQLTAVFAAPALLAALPSGRLADRFGGSVIAASGALLAAGGMCLILLLPGLNFLLVGSAVIGLGNMLTMVGQQTLVAHVSRADHDGAYGFLSASVSAGQMVGPPVVTALAAALGSTDLPNTSAGLVLCLGLILLAVPLSVPLGSVERRHAQSARESARESAQEDAGGRFMTAGLWRAMVISGVVLVSMDMLYMFLPIWALDKGVAVGTVGLLLSVRAGVSLLSRVGLSHIVRKLGRSPVIVLSTMVAAVAMALLPVVDIAGAFVIMVLLGVGLGIPQPLTMAWAVSLTDSARHGLVLGLRLGVNRLAQITIPLAMSATVASHGASGVFWTTSSLLAGCTALAALGPGASTRTKGE